jgi:signal transduction histidine kinase
VENAVFMSPSRAFVPAATLAPDPASAGEAARRLRAEQLLLLCRQWLRVPLPVLATATVIAYLAWDHAPRALLVAWAVATVAAVAARMRLCQVVLKEGRAAAQPERWSRMLTAIAGANGLISGAAAPLFLPMLPPTEQALLTMLMGCWGAGAVAANGSFPPAYYAFAWPFFAQLVAAWLFSGQEAYVWVMPILLMFVALLSSFVRENGSMVREAIGLRFANEKLLETKEQLIGLLRAAYDKAEAARHNAEQASRSKSQFLASASHDLRQPLHALSLLTALLADLSEDTRVREVGRHIGQSVQSLERLFNAILDLSKLDAGAVAPELRKFDLAELARQFSDEYRAKAVDKGLRFELECEPIWVLADPILLERILRNLLENAMRFTDSGRVVLRARRAGRDAIVTVTDTGRGIPATEQARVFEEFYQLHNPGRDRSKGLGLGLSIVKRLVDLLGYRIELASTPGHGTAFTLTLNGALTEAPEAAEREVAAAPAAADVAGLRVLVIEDDSEARLAIELTLRNWGCATMTAASLDEARSVLARAGSRPDVLLSDLRLGNGADGIAAIEALQAEFGPMPAALVTGDISGERLRELRAAALAVLHKPVKPEILRELLHRLARGVPPD